MVLKLNIRTLASPQPQRSDWGLRVTQDAYFSLTTHTKQLLLVTFSDMTAECVMRNDITLQAGLKDE